MAFLRWLVTAVIAVLVLGFTLSNLERVDVHLTPFHDPYILPLYFVILGSIAVGFIWGGILVWMNASVSRKEAKQYKKKAERLEKELEEEREARAIRTSEIIEAEVTDV